MALLTNINGKFSVSDVGAVTFNNAFTFPTTDGAANYVLQTNGSGQLAWALNGNGDISGSGTANTVTKFTGAKTIGNGPITFSGNNSTFAGSITIPDYIYHAGDGDTYFGFSANDEFLVVAGGSNKFAADANAAYMYYQGSLKLQTTSTGISVSGTSSTFAGDVSVEDNLYLTDAGTVRGKIQLNSSDRDNLDIKAISLGSLMRFYTADTLALTLNATQNATFVGTVTAPTFSGDLNGTINTVTTATTKGNSTNDTTVATTAFVQNVIGTIPAGLVFQGTWNASTNTPTLTSGSGTTGNFYIVSVAGSTNLDGITDWKVGDWAVFIEQGASDQWEKIDNSSVLDGIGTGQTLPLWDGSGTSNTLTNSRFTQTSTQNIITGPGTAGSDLSINVKNSAGQVAIQALGTGEVVIPSNYLFVSSSQGAYIAAILRARGGVTDDLGTLNLGGNGQVDNLVLNSNTSATFAGNVGIGGSPTFKLDVLSNGTSLRLNSSDANGSYVTWSNNGTANGFMGSGYHLWSSPNNIATTLGIRAQTRLDLGIQGSVHMTILNTGNVGIGTTSPDAKLHVEGGIGIFNVSDDWQQSTLGTYLFRGANFATTISNETSTLKIFPAAEPRAVGEYWGGINFMHLDPENSTWGTSYTGAQFWVGGRITSQVGQELSALVFAVNSLTTTGSQPTEKMVILPNGNVGIGTASPDGVLHIKKDNAPATFEIQGGLNTQITAGAINGEINFGVNDASTTGGIGASIKNISEISNGAHNGLAFFTGLQSRTPYLQQMLYFTARGGLSFGTTNNSYGTSGQILKSNADAPPSWIDGSAIPGVPAGSGTLNTVAMWTPDGDTLGDSPITISGNDIISSGRGVIENTTNLTTGIVDSLLIKTLSSGTTITNGFGAGLSFYLENTVYSAVNEVAKIAVIETDTIAIDDKMVFSVKDNNILAERLTLTGQEAVFTGNVGIGNTGPYTKLLVGSRGTAAATSISAIDGLAFDFYNDGPPYKRHGVIISQAADASESVLDFNTKAASGTNSTKMTILGNGNVGIGTATPGTKLDVNGATYVRNVIYGYAGAGNQYGGLSWGGTDEGFLFLKDSNVTKVNINSNGNSYLNGGNVGIGSTNPTSISANTNSLTVGSSRNDLSGAIVYQSNGTVKAQSYWDSTGWQHIVNSGTARWYTNATLNMELNTSGTLTVKADLVAYGSPSDKRLKENIKPIESALDKVMKLEGVTFDWKEKEDAILEIKEDIGFIAQDVQKVIPELVRENDNGMLSMRHQGIAPILLEAIKELKAEIEELKLNKCNCNK